MPPLILCHPLLLPSFSPNIRGFSCESPISIRWSKYWSFSFSINPSNEHPGFISFKIDWFDLLAVQVTLKSLRQQQSLKASILQHSVFFTGFPGSSDGKESSCNAGDPCLIPASGRSPGEGIGYYPSILGLPCGSVSKESACNARDLGLIPEL